MTLYERYQPGGDIYARLADVYGKAGADYAAARAGDTVTLNQALSDLKTAARSGTPVAEVANKYTGSTSTLGLFLNQITTDPLAAPLDSLNDQVGKAVWNVVKNPFVLALVVGAVWWKFFRKP